MISGYVCKSGASGISEACGMACILLSISSFAPPAAPRTWPRHPYMRVRWRRRIVPVHCTEVRIPQPVHSVWPASLPPLLPSPHHPPPCPLSPELLLVEFLKRSPFLGSCLCHFCFAWDVEKQPLLHTSCVSFKAVRSVTLAGPPWLPELAALVFMTECLFA